MKGKSGLIFLLLGIAACGAQENNAPSSGLRQTIGLPQDPSALNLWLLTSTDDAGSRGYQVLAELQNNSNLGVTWSQRFGSKFNILFDDPVTTKIELRLSGDHFVNDGTIQNPSTFQSLHNQGFWISPTLNKREVMITSAPPRTPRALTSEGRSPGPLSQRRLYKCLFPGVYDEILWEGADASTIQPLSILFQKSSSNIVHEFTASDQGAWTVPASLFEFDDLFSPSLRQSLEASFGSSEIEASRMLIRKIESQRVVINTNPPGELLVNAYEVEQAQWNLQYRGGCEP